MQQAPPLQLTGIPLLLGLSEEISKMYLDHVMVGRAEDALVLPEHGHQALHTALVHLLQLIGHTHVALK